MTARPKCDRTAFFLSGWQRLWNSLEHASDRVWIRLLCAEDRYQMEHSFGKYSYPAGDKQ